LHHHDFPPSQSVLLPICRGRKRPAIHSGNPIPLNGWCRNWKPPFYHGHLKKVRAVREPRYGRSRGQAPQLPVGGDVPKITNSNSRPAPDSSSVRQPGQDQHRVDEPHEPIMPDVPPCGTILGFSRPCRTYDLELRTHVSGEKPKETTRRAGYLNGRDFGPAS
jgi:hypothetical protein